MPDLQIKDSPLSSRCRNCNVSKCFRTRTTNDGAEAMAALKGLKTFKLDYTSIDDKGLEFLKTLPAVSELSLDTTNVTDNGAQALKTMAGLKALNLYHTL